MSQSGYTPIQLYRTTTAAATPSAGSLAAGELAINLTDEKLYFKNASGTVKLMASSAGALGTVTSVNVSGGTTGLSFSGGPVTSSGTITMAGTLGVANGGTGATSLAANYLIKGNGTSAASASGIYQNGSYFGIGTTGPATLLDAQETLNGQGGISYVNLSTGAASAAAISVEAGGSYFYHSVTRATGVVQFRGVTSTTLNQDFNTQVFRSTGGSEYMRINSSGNVGIGTSSPGAKLQVATPASGAGVIFRYTSGTNNPGLYFTTTEATSVSQIDATGSTGVNTLAFAVNSTERMRIDSAGSVGIGTTVMFDKLNVLGAGANISVDTLTSSENNGFVIRSVNTERGSLRMQGSTGLMTLTAGYAGYGGILAINTNGAERMRIDSAGNVGIGTTAPSEKLSVSGNIQLSAGAIKLDEAWQLQWGTGVSYVNGNNTSVYSNAGGQRWLSATNSTVALSTSGVERMRIDTYGSVGIGTTTPSSGSLLDVQSTTRGVRFPNMTTTQKNAIAASAGTVVFDTTLSKLCVYTGAAWQTITSA